MAYDEQLVCRVDDVLTNQTGIVKKKMFGVVCYMRNGYAFGGVWNQSLIVRIGPISYERTLRESFVREFDITGRPMKGWVVVGPQAIEERYELDEWLARAMDFVATLPKKLQRVKKPGTDRLI